MAGMRRRRRRKGKGKERSSHTCALVRGILISQMRTRWWWWCGVSRTHSRDQFCQSYHPLVGRRCVHAPTSCAGEMGTALLSTIGSFVFGVSISFGAPAPLPAAVEASAAAASSFRSRWWSERRSRRRRVRSCSFWVRMGSSSSPRRFRRLGRRNRPSSTMIRVAKPGPPPAYAAHPGDVLCLSIAASAAGDDDSARPCAIFLPAGYLAPLTLLFHVGSPHDAADAENGEVCPELRDRGSALLKSLEVARSEQG